MNFRVPPTQRWPLAFRHQRFLFRGHRFPRWFRATFLLQKVSVRSSSFRAASSAGGGGGGREGSFLLIPGATMATLLMFGFLHARRMYDDRKVQDMRQKGIEPEFSPDAKAAFLRLLPLRSISRLWGNLMSVEIPAWSRPFIYKAWARAFHCDLDEASLPLENYASLQDFFVRSLKEGTRPIDPDPKSMVSPVDGKVLRLGELKGPGSMIEQVKGFSYSAVSLLGANSTIHEAANEDGNKKYPLQISEDLSKKSWWHVSFASPKVRNPVTSPKKDIYYCVIYLNPGDYHRVHSPVDWKVLSRRHFSGHLYPTNERAVRTIRNLHIENERVVLEGQWNEGFLAIAAIGATNVGSIKLLIEPELRTNRPMAKLFPSGSPDERVYDPPGVGLMVKKGEEIAVFNMGSTVVLVFQAPVSELSESNCISDFKFSVGVGDRIRVGEAIGKWGNS